MGISVTLGSPSGVNKPPIYVGEIAERAHQRILERIFEYSPLRDGSGVQLGFPLLNRLRDPYANAHYAVSELDALRSEVEELRAELGSDDAVQTALAYLRKACLDGRDGGRPVECIGD